MPLSNRDLAYRMQLQFLVEQFYYAEAAALDLRVNALKGERLEAKLALEAAGVASDVICLTSADLVFRALQARRGLREGSDEVLESLFDPARAAPLVTVLDGHPHTLAFLSGVHGAPCSCLGVQDFGQSGDVHDLYRYFGIDTDTIVGAALDLIQ